MIHSFKAESTVGTFSSGSFVKLAEFSVQASRVVAIDGPCANIFWLSVVRMKKKGFILLATL